MIPDIGIIIASYVCFRMIEVWCFKSDRYSNETARFALGALSVIVILVALFFVFDIIRTGAGIGTPPR